jgi:hypothetical protein
LYLHMEASQHSLLAACFTLHSINATLAIVPQRGAGLWIIITFNIHKISLKSHFLFNCCNMFRPNEAIIRQLILDRNHHTAWTPRQYIYVLSSCVVIIQECTPALHSCYFLVAASMLCFIARSLPCRACIFCNIKIKLKEMWYTR